MKPRYPKPLDGCVFLCQTRGFDAWYNKKQDVFLLVFSEAGEHLISNMDAVSRSTDINWANTYKAYKNYEDPSVSPNWKTA